MQRHHDTGKPCLQVYILHRSHKISDHDTVTVSVDTYRISITTLSIFSLSCGVEDLSWGLIVGTRTS